MSSKKSVELLKTIANFMTKTEGFDKCLRTLTIVGGGQGKCQAEFKVLPEHLNRGGGLHGGFSATIVDVVTTYALMTMHEDMPKPGVSVNLSVSYLKGAKEGDDLYIEATTLKAGKTLAFLECEIKHKKDDSIVAKGAHTKFIG
ncbi:unnamed protein product [Diamesa serratosioi]